MRSSSGTGWVGLHPECLFMADSTLWLRRCICCWNPEQPQPSPSLPHPVLLCACTACTAPCLLQGDHLAVADRRAAPPQAHAPGRWVGAPACSLPACLFSAAAAAGPTSGGVLHPLPACHACSSIGHCRYSFCLTSSAAACCLFPLALPAEARGGLHIVEQSLWSTLTQLLRRMSCEGQQPEWPEGWGPATLPWLAA